MSKVTKRHFLREKEAEQLLKALSQKLRVDSKKLLEPRICIEQTETQDEKIYFINGKPLLARLDGMLLPTLKFEEVLSLIPKLIVDMGAVSYVCNGADVMAPGVVKIKGNFQEGDFLVVADERHGKPLAIGIALTDSQNAKTLRCGKMAKNIHFIGDKLWTAMKNI
jgi:PUA-domain protein